ncbi:DUF1156 domain-containing protein [Pseudoalteromonas gelatinilytica]
MTNMKIPKKLIEVALPLDDINAAASREKSIRHGHPSTLHLWWARRPLAAARAVIFAQMVNDPGYESGKGFKRGVNKRDAEIKREELFDIIRDLVKWENTNDESVLNRAKRAIEESWQETCELNKNHPEASTLFNPNVLPGFHDPFAGGGAIPLEAQRLGLSSHASDLNPVAVLINKAMIEIPPKFFGLEPIGPLEEKIVQGNIIVNYDRASGLAEDVLRYGKWLQKEASKRLSHLYPQYLVSNELANENINFKPFAGKNLTVIAWIWARTVKSPNPAYKDVDVPLISNFVLSSKKGSEVYLEPVIDGSTYDFRVVHGTPPPEAKNGTKTARGANFNCIISGAPISSQYIKSEGVEGRIGQKLVAVVAEGKKGRVYLPADLESEKIAHSPQIDWAPNTPIAHDKRSMFTPLYGLTTFADLFTKRQLATLNIFSGLIDSLYEKVLEDAKNSEIVNGKLTDDYAKAICVYLSFAINKMADRGSTICSWDASRGSTRNTFGRQAIPMTWDFAEPNPFSSSTGNFMGGVNWINDVLKKMNGVIPGKVFQKDAATQDISFNKVISTDPPYYDNIGYADLSDFFYVWLRKSLRKIVPDLFATMAVPKSEELVANPYRQGSKEQAESFFLTGMTQAMFNMSNLGHPAFPVSIYYAFKSSETKKGNTVSTGWETFLEAVIQSGFEIHGTWPMRTEMSNRMVGSGTNALASSVVLICTKRQKSDQTISRREFQRELKQFMPDALEAMIGGREGSSPIAPVDLAQSAIGPGIAIFSKYDSIIESDGSKMSVHDALILINRAITEYLNPDSGNFDSDTLFCDDWFSQYGWGEGIYGEADTLARAKGTSVDGVKEAGVVESGGGKVRLLKWEEYPQDWDPKNDNRTPVWEACHQLIRALNQQGEVSAGALLARMPERGEQIRQLAYHLYTLCERKGWAEEARAYNELIGSWHSIVAASHEIGHKDEQLGMDF